MEQIRAQKGRHAVAVGGDPGPDRIPRVIEWQKRKRQGDGVRSEVMPAQADERKNKQWNRSRARRPQINMRLEIQIDVVDPCREKRNQVSKTVRPPVKEREFLEADEGGQQ